MGRKWAGESRQEKVSGLVRRERCLVAVLCGLNTEYQEAVGQRESMNKD